MIGGGWEVVVDGLGRLEAPCLDLAGQLCFSDIAGDGAIYRLGHNGLLEAVLLGRSHVGGLVVHADGGLVASGHTVAVIDDNEQRIVMTPEGGWGFNDLTSDASGKVLRVTPDGAEDLVLETPRTYVSAVCFGRSDGRDPYVTTFGGAPYDLEHSGSVIHTRVDVPAARITPARV